jgi:hypothetical protein
MIRLFTIPGQALCGCEGTIRPFLGVAPPIGFSRRWGSGGLLGEIPRPGADQLRGFSLFTCRASFAALSCRAGRSSGCAAEGAVVLRSAVTTADREIPTSAAIARSDMPCRHENRAGSDLANLLLCNIRAGPWRFFSLVSVSGRRGAAAAVSAARIPSMLGFPKRCLHLCTRCAVRPCEWSLRS